MKFTGSAGGSDVAAVAKAALVEAHSYQNRVRSPASSMRSLRRMRRSLESNALICQHAAGNRQTSSPSRQERGQHWQLAKLRSSGYQLQQAVGSTGRLSVSSRNEEVSPAQSPPWLSHLQGSCPSKALRKAVREQLTTVRRPRHTVCRHPLCNESLSESCQLDDQKSGS